MINITIFAFNEAPKDLRALSQHGGDEEDCIVLMNKINTIHELPTSDFYSLERVLRGMDPWGSVLLDKPQVWRGYFCWITAHA